MGEGKTIIAEVGSNHCGDMDLAIGMIAIAKEYGADFAKFQLYDTNKLDRPPDILKMCAETELNKEQAKYLFDYGEMMGIEVFFSVFDVERVRWCEEIGVKR